MKRILKIFLGLLGLLLLLLAGAAWALHRWVGTDDFRQRIEQQASQAAGVGVTVARIDIDWWPVPAVALHDLKLATQPVLSVGLLEVRPELAGLWQRQFAVQSVVVRQATLPQRAIDALQKARANPSQAKDTPGSPSSQNPALQWIPRRTLLDHVTWVSPQGQAITVDAELQLGGDHWPEALRVKLLQGPLPGSQVQLKAAETSGPQQHRWQISASLAGGSIEGPLQLTTPASGEGEFKLHSELNVRGVDVAALTAPAKTLSGRLQARTTLDARWTQMTQLPEALRSSTRFDITQAVVHGIDLAKAVRTAGLSRGGETPLDTLSGQLTTQGRALQLTELQAKSGLLAAHGQVSVSPAKALSGQVDVDLGTQLVGVPLQVGGTVDHPEVKLSRAAMLGATVGSVVLPVVGTGAGAKLGDKIGKLFGK